MPASRILPRAAGLTAALLAGSLLQGDLVAAPLQSRILTGPAEDTFIQSNQPKVNYGRQNALEIGSPGGVERRVLIRFDLAELGEGAQVESAELLLRVTQFPGEGVAAAPVAAHRLLVPWAEGDGEGSATKPGRAGVTWASPDRAVGSKAWAAPGAGGAGADRAEEPTDVADLRDQERLTALPGIPAKFLVLDVTDDLKRFQSGAAPNHGWLLSLPPEIDARIRFNSKDAGEEARLPRLRITYRPAVAE